MTDITRDDFRAAVERHADIVARILDPLIETACQRPLTMREADAADEALWNLRKAMADLEARRLTG
jgi:hypothetical protein